MAMNDELDRLVSLYASASHDTSSPLIDARIVRAAERVANRRRAARHLAWPIAFAAAVMLWMAFHAMPPPPGNTAPHDAQLTADLSRLDVTPAYSDVTRYLTRAANAHDSLVSENDP